MVIYNKKNNIIKNGDPYITSKIYGYKKQYRINEQRIVIPYITSKFLAKL